MTTSTTAAGSCASLTLPTSTASGTVTADAETVVAAERVLAGAAGGGESLPNAPSVRPGGPETERAPTAESASAAKNGNEARDACRDLGLSGQQLVLSKWGWRRMDGSDDDIEKNEDDDGDEDDEIVSDSWSASEITFSSDLDSPPPAKPVQSKKSEEPGQLKEAVGQAEDVTLFFSREPQPYHNLVLDTLMPSRIRTPFSLQYFLRNRQTPQLRGVGER